MTDTFQGSLRSPERAKMALDYSLKNLLVEDIIKFNEELRLNIEKGIGTICVTLPSVERVKQLAEALHTKGYIVKAYDGIIGTYLEVKL